MLNSKSDWLIERNMLFHIQLKIFQTEVIPCLWRAAKFKCIALTDYFWVGQDHKSTTPATCRTQNLNFLVSSLELSNLFLLMKRDLFWPCMLYENSFIAKFYSFKDNCDKVTATTIYICLDHYSIKGQSDNPLEMTSLIVNPIYMYM